MGGGGASAGAAAAGDLTWNCKPLCADTRVQCNIDFTPRGPKRGGGGEVRREKIAEARKVLPPPHRILFLQL